MLLISNKQQPTLLLATGTPAVLLHSASAGANSFGQLGLGDQVKRHVFSPIMSLANKDIVTLQAGDHNSGAIGADGTVYLWGRCLGHRP